MKKIKNTSLQSISLTFFDKGKEVNYFLKPKKEIIIPDHYSNLVINNLIKRKIITCKTIQPEIAQSKESTVKKSKEIVENKNNISLDQKTK